MSIDKAVDKFDKLLNHITDIMPLAVLKDGSIGYANYIVKKNKFGKWDLIQYSKRHRSTIDTFYQKTCALISAKLHKNNNIMGMAKTKDLDLRYWNNYSDTIIFDKLYNQTDDKAKKDTYLWRYEVCKLRADNYKQQISQQFIQSFK
ncbi:MAG: hypothetical protein EBS49_02515 [Verrucomicrobia bacterium]|nr:hypothetical protein [Verrucomicrobiota bacterium]